MAVWVLVGSLCVRQQHCKLQCHQRNNSTRIHDVYASANS